MHVSNFATLTKYSQSPEFTNGAIPDALLRAHQTKKGVWGKIVVTSGQLIYLRQGKPAQMVTPDAPAVIYPQERHNVSAKGAVTFRVEFYRATQTTPKEGAKT